MFNVILLSCLKLPEDVLRVLITSQLRVLMDYICCCRIECRAVYSSREVGKLQCFHWIKERVARPPLRYCVVGDGIDECEAAHILSWPFVKINMGPYAVHRLPAVSMDVLDDYMKVVYGPPDRLPAAVG